MHPSIIIEDLGLQPYSKVWQYQQELFEQNIDAKKQKLTTRNILLLCEHDPVITIGKNGNADNLLLTPEYLEKNGIGLFRTDRGGDITYHGPGQLVAYPIFDLESFGIGLRQYIWTLEEIMIRFLKEYDIEGERDKNAAGVWLDVEAKDKIRKIGAIGVHCSRYITMHGFALNINTDLSYFSLINSCGFVDKGVTSLQKETGYLLEMKKAKGEIRLLFERLFLPLNEKQAHEIGNRKIV